MINLRGVLAQDVMAWWPKVEHWITQALEHGPRLYNTADVLSEILARDMQLWLACEGEEPIGVVVTSIITFPRRTVLLIGPIGGIGVRRWIKPMDDLIQAYAVANGCDIQLSEGRPGWDRLVGNQWRVTATQYVREITR